MDPRHRSRRYATAHDLGQSVYRAERMPGARAARPEDLRRGLQVHARLEAAHLGRSVTTYRTFPWDWVGVGTFLLLVLGVALWIH